MKKKKQKLSFIIIGLLIILGATIIVSLFVFLSKEESATPSISLLGEKKIFLDEGETYKELGAVANDGSGKDITENIKITGEVNNNESGTYYLYYNVRNKYGIKAKEIVRTVIIGGEQYLQKNRVKEIAIEVIAEHKDELLQFGDETCKKVDYLVPFINEYYKDGEEPEREIVRPTVKALLTKDQ